MADISSQVAGPTGLRMFPILWNYRVTDHIKKLQAADVPYMPVCMPWEMLAPHAHQAQRNHGQSLERLAERGGLDPGEALAILDGYNVCSRNVPIEKACHELCRRIAAWVTQEVARAEAEPSLSPNPAPLSPETGTPTAP